MAVCADQPSAVLTHPFGDGVGVYKVGGKMFALCGLLDDPMRITLKGEPDLVVALVRRATRASIPGFHMNKRYWVTVTLDGELPDEFVDELVEDSYDLVVDGLPKRLRPQRHATVLNGCGSRRPGRGGGAPDRSRTDDILITSEALYQLSYGGVQRAHDTECVRVPLRPRSHARGEPPRRGATPRLPTVEDGATS